MCSFLRIELDPLCVHFSESPWNTTYHVTISVVAVSDIWWGCSSLWGVLNVTKLTHVRETGSIRSFSLCILPHTLFVKQCTLAGRGDGLLGHVTLNRAPAAPTRQERQGRELERNELRASNPRWRQAPDRPREQPHHHPLYISLAWGCQYTRLPLVWLCVPCIFPKLGMPSVLARHGRLILYIFELRLPPCVLLTLHVWFLEGGFFLFLSFTPLFFWTD